MGAFYTSSLRDDYLRVIAILLFSGWSIVVSFAQGALAQSSVTPPFSAPSPTVPGGTTVNGALTPLVVTGRQDSLVGVAGSAAEGVVGQDELSQRPIFRPGEVLETVPGMIVTQHAGGGKANQYFLRGFNLDHGTDFAFHIDGVPINLPTNAHGQGYSDLNFLIPELIETVDYAKGPYYAKYGDFASAGAADLHYFDRLPANLALTTIGTDGYVRGLLAMSHTFGEHDLFDCPGKNRVLPEVNPGTVLGAIEVSHNDGPWVHPEDFRKLSFLLRYTQGSASNGFSLTVNGYSDEWNGENQVAVRAIRRGLVDYFGNLDPSDGGISQRYIVTVEWHGQLTDDSFTDVTLYAQYYDLDLFSDFTYFLNNPVLGDQFEQKDQRSISGLKIDHKIFGHWFGRDVTNDFGLQIRNDYIFDVALNHTNKRNVYEQLSDDRVIQTSISPYFENRLQWTDWFRTVIGGRGDLYLADVRDKLGGPNGGNSTSFLTSPKIQLILGPWYNTEFYLDGGFGFHSNDARGTTIRQGPVSEGGLPVTRSPLLVQQRGAEFGIRTTAVPHLQTTFSLWYLVSDSELVFAGDTGDTQATPAGERWGIELNNYYTPYPWLTLDLDYAWSNARYSDHNPAGQYVPEAVEQVLDAGISIHDFHGFEAGLRCRYFGPRALIEDNSVRSKPTTLLYATVGYQFSKTWSVQLGIFNLLNSRVNDIEYYYPSRLKNEPPGPDGGGYNDRHIHPAESRNFRVTITARF